MMADECEEHVIFCSLNCILLIFVTQCVQTNRLNSDLDPSRSRASFFSIGQKNTAIPLGHAPTGNCFRLGLQHSLQSHTITAALARLNEDRQRLRLQVGVLFWTCWGHSMSFLNERIRNWRAKGTILEG